MEIRLAHTDAEIDACFPVMVQLRPALSRDGFVARVRELERGGYRLAYLRDLGDVRAVAGFRVGDMLARGRHLYVDDLVTDGEARSGGYGRALFDWLVDRARAEGCGQLDLDSGVQRAGAHRFYFRQGMAIPSFHFAMRLETGSG